MKKQFGLGLLSIGLCIFSFSANAQNVDVAKVSLSENSAQNFSTLNTSSVNVPSISEEAVNNFENNFKAATEVKWAVIKNGYFVTCVVSGQKTEVAFNTNGKFNYSITTLNSSNIPENLKQIINSEYSDYSIIKAIQIKTPENILNQVILKSNKQFITLKSNGEDIEVTSLKNAGQ